jgi:hypothetical protein
MSDELIIAELKRERDKLRADLAAAYKNIENLQADLNDCPSTQLIEAQVESRYALELASLHQNLALAVEALETIAEWKDGSKWTANQTLAKLRNKENV